MWISSSEWEAVQKRLIRLEEEVLTLRYRPTGVSVKDERQYISAYDRDVPVVPFAQVIHMILRHLGLELLEKKAEPQGFYVEKSTPAQGKT